MVIIVGGKSQFVSDDLLVAKDSIDLIGACVETLIVEFSQVMYEEFL